MKKEAIAERDVFTYGSKKNLKEGIIEEAHQKATAEYNRIIENAKEAINYEKIAAMTELKNQIANFSILIAEKILEKDFQIVLSSKNTSTSF